LSVHVVDGEGARCSRELRPVISQPDLASNVHWNVLATPLILNALFWMHELLKRQHTYTSCIRHTWKHC